MPQFQFPNGSILNADSRHELEAPVFLGMDENELRTFVATLWIEAFEGKRAETERLKTCSLYYDGFHYNNAWLNRRTAIENYCFSTVETVHPIMTETRPRAKISARNSITDLAGKSQKLRATAQWLQDADDFDHRYKLGIRDMLKYGWGWWFVSIDASTGMPFLKNGSVFNYYPDPTATNDEEMEYFFIAQPVQTTRLQSFFPARAAVIQPDNVASPSYDVHVRPYMEYLENAHRYGTMSSIDSSLAFWKESGDPNPQPTSSVALVPSTGSYREYGKTTYLLQLYVRDASMMKVTYMGDLSIPQSDGNYAVVPGMHYNCSEPACPSGWRVITMTYDGQFPEWPKPLEDIYGPGGPIVTVMDYQQTDRYWPTGELDHVIPVQRGINRQITLMDRALELAANPAVITNQDSGLPADMGPVAAGDVLRVRRGSEVRFLEYRGPSEFQFEMLSAKKHAADVVSGAYEAQRGERPAGIEAASAIKRLQNAADVRVRGKENGCQRARAQLLKKLMTVMARKLAAPIWLKGVAANGGDVVVEADDLDAEYDIQFEEGSGTVAGQQESFDQAFEMFQAKAIDVQALLEAANWPDAATVAQRMAAQQLAEAVAVAKAKAQSGGPPPPGGKKTA